MRRAVCILVFDQTKRVLAVSRRNEVSQWGLIGGKVDPGESSVQAAAREFYEETGVAISTDCLEPLYCAACPGDEDFFCTTFIYAGMLDSLTPFTPEPGLSVMFLSRDTLCMRDMSPFALYNIGVFAALEQLRS
jgi:8-oxo-dGTP pyrophosphatase MutT (NUDIX family)